MKAEKQIRNYKNNEVVDFKGKKQDQISVSETIAAVGLIALALLILVYGSWAIFGGQ